MAGPELDPSDSHAGIVAVCDGPGSESVVEKLAETSERSGAQVKRFDAKYGEQTRISVEPGKRGRSRIGLERSGEVSDTPIMVSNASEHSVPLAEAVARFLCEVTPEDLRTILSIRDIHRAAAAEGSKDLEEIAQEAARAIEMAIATAPRRTD